MGKGKFNQPRSQHRSLKKHMQKNMGFETFSDRIKRKIKEARVKSESEGE